jgi:hypothetical protein
LLAKSNTGFAIATPVGVAIGSVFAALSTRELSGDSAVRNVRIGKRLRLLLLGLMVVWGVWSVAALPPLNRPPQFAEARCGSRCRRCCSTPGAQCVTSNCGYAIPP